MEARPQGSESIAFPGILSAQHRAHSVGLMNSEPNKHRSNDRQAAVCVRKGTLTITFLNLEGGGGFGGCLQS